MKVGLAALYLMRESFPTLLKEMERSGVRNWELVDEGRHQLDRRRVRLLKRLKDALGLEYALHGPLADVNIASYNRSIRRVVISRLLRSLDHARELGARVWVFHPGTLTELSGLYRGQDRLFQEESIGQIVDAARGLGIPTGIENMPAIPGRYLLVRVEEFTGFYAGRELGQPGLVLDVGHAHTAHQLPEFLEQLGSWIVHIHAHDNDTTFDRHRAIGNGTIDWELVLRGLHRAGFEGMLAVESMREPVESVRHLEQKLAQLQ